LSLSFVLGLAACAIALPLAAAIGRAYAAFSASLLNFSLAGFSVPVWSYAIQLAVGVLMPVIAASVPVIRGCRVSVNDALRDVGIDARTSPAPGRMLRLASGVARPLLLSLRNAFRRRQRMALTLVTLAMGGAVYLGALDLRASIRGSVDLLYGTLMKFDMIVSLNDPHGTDSIETVASRVQGVAVAEAWGGVRAAVSGSDGLMHDAFQILALPPDSRLVAFPALRGRWLTAADTHGIVVNKRLIDDDPDLAAGGDATLIIRGHATHWHVLGVVDGGPSPAAYVIRGALAGLSNDRRVTGIMIRATARGVGAQSELLQRVRDELGSAGLVVASAQLMDANRHVIEDHVLMVAGFLLIMSQMIIVVGGLGLASTMSLSVLERTREVGVLRAIGASRAAIVTMVQTEGLVIGLLSWALAVPLSLPVSLMLGRAFGRVMFPVPVMLVPQVSGVVWWLAVVLVVTVVACTWPAARAMRITTREALAYE
jgi:putative ABC transport system permease protein